MTDIPAILYCALMRATGDQLHLEDRVLPQVANQPELLSAAARASHHLGAACEALRAARALVEK